MARGSGTHQILPLIPRGSAAPKQTEEKGQKPPRALALETVGAAEPAWALEIPGACSLGALSSRLCLLRPALTLERRGETPTCALDEPQRLEARGVGDPTGSQSADASWAA